MTDIYKQHESAFARVSAYVVTRDGERVATIAFKYPQDGAGRLYAYVHWLGLPMVRGFAGGYGYDKRSAACANAAKKITGEALKENNRYTYHDMAAFAAFLSAIEKDSGATWESQLRDAGFTVWQAV